MAEIKLRTALESEAGLSDALFLTLDNGRTFHVAWATGTMTNKDAVIALRTLADIAERGGVPSNDYVMRDGKMVAA